ncbi:MAG TPA: response regulator transcription factor, partial [Vicinamibacteria bacterium]|nr:response regulator transcription factor [Vicinamibacteria bacterium]
ILEPVAPASRLAWLQSHLSGPPGEADDDRRPPGLVPAPPEAPPLTPREREVLRHIAAGLQNKEVAARLRLSTATVRNHVHHILDKLQVHSKLEAVSLAFQRGWVPAHADGSEERSGVVRAAVASRRS